MKGNDGSGNIEERDVWETPQWMFDEINKQYNFHFDCCASIKNKKTIWFSDDFIKCNNEEVKDIMCWMNPPFSKAKEMFEHFFKTVSYGVAIYRCDNLETSLYQDIILKNANWIFIPKGRWNYEGMEGKGSRFPSALIGYKVNPPKNLDGYVLHIRSRGR